MADLLKDLLDLFFGRGISLKATFDLGSGYNDMADKEAKRAKLKAICDEVLASDAYKPRNGLTYCNVATRHIAEHMGCYDFDESMTANKQVAHVEANWKSVTAEEAQAHAEVGGLAVAAKTFPAHGHISVVYPAGAALPFSGSWGKKVPWTANVGRKNGVLKASEAFPVAEGEPGYYRFG